MKIPFWIRLLLYALAAALPVWKDWVKLTADFTLHGLLAPILDSLYQVVITLMAKISPSKAEEDASHDGKTIDLTGSDVKVTPPAATQ